MIGSPTVQAHWAKSCLRYTLLPKRDLLLLHPIPNGDSGPSCFISTSSHRHGLCTSYSSSFHPWKSCHVTTRSCASTYVTPWPLWQGLVIVVIVSTYVAPLYIRGNSSLSSCHHYTTNMVDWVVQCSNHHAILSLATTGLDLLVPTPRHGSPPVVPRLAPSSITLCIVPRPKVPVYRHRGCWPFVYVMPQDVAVYHHAGCSSLTSWGMFQAAQAMLGWDVLIIATLASLACKSCKLIHDVSHHGQTSVGHAHRYSVPS
jgi:hypothetical protein